MSESKLKPCPFCGGEACVEFGACDYNVYQVLCENCSAMCGWDETVQGAISHWNTRIETK